MKPRLLGCSSAGPLLALSVVRPRLPHPSVGDKVHLPLRWLPRLRLRLRRTCLLALLEFRDLPLLLLCLTLADQLRLPLLVLLDPVPRRYPESSKHFSKRAIVEKAYEGEKDLGRFFASASCWDLDGRDVALRLVCFYVALVDDLVEGLVTSPFWNIVLETRSA